MKPWYLAFVVLACVLPVSCSLFSDPIPYDPLQDSWVLVAENDFSTDLVTTTIPIFMAEGDPTAVIDDGRLRYTGDSFPDDKIWICTDYGFTDTSTDYKIYIEPTEGLDGSDENIYFHLWNNTFDGKISGVLSNETIRLSTWGGGPSDQFFGETSFPSGMDFSSIAFELIIEGFELTLRLIDLNTSNVKASVTGALQTLDYYDGHDIRLRLSYIGTIFADNFRIYAR